MDDYAYTAENLKHIGKVLINNYLYPKCNHYEKGGIGTYPERVHKKILDCKYLMNKYPKLFRYFKKNNCHPEAEIVIRLHTEKQIEKWRKENE